MVKGQENLNLNKADVHRLEPRNVEPENEMNEDIKPAVVPPTLRLFYEIIHELNDSCQLHFTTFDILNLVNNMDTTIPPDDCDQTFCADDLKSQIVATEYALHSIQQVHFGQHGEISKYDECPNNLPEIQLTRLTSLSSLHSNQSRYVFVKPKPSRLVIKLTSQEHLAFRHYNNTGRCIEKLNRCLSKRNLQISFSSKKSRLTVKGNCDFDRFSFSVCSLKLINLAVNWWSKIKDENYSNSSLPLLEAIKSSSSKQPVKVGETQNEENFSSGPNGAAAGIRLVANVEDTKSHARHLMSKCKDFPDCSNTNPNQIIFNSCCKVEYIVKPTQHSLFIRADQQFDIVTKLNLRFKGVRISLLRKFAAFHVLHTEGVDPQLAINAIDQLKRRCLSMDDILQDENFKKKPCADNLDAPSKSCQSCVKNVELKPLKKPQFKLNPKPQREFCRRNLAAKSQIKGRERNGWRRQKEHQQRKNQEIAKGPYSAQAFHHFENPPQYGNSYYEDKGKTEYGGRSYNADYNAPVSTGGKMNGLALKWEPAPFCPQYPIPSNHGREF